MLFFYHTILLAYPQFSIKNDYHDKKKSFPEILHNLHLRLITE